MKEWVFLLEERSAQAMLEGLLPRIGVSLPMLRFIVFEGKRDLERNISKRLKAYRNPQAQFVVIRDLDASPDCRVVKSRLAELCLSAGKPAALIRVFCRELEAVYLGDLRAVECGLGVRGLAQRQNERKFRSPDAIQAPSRELALLTGGMYQKIGGSRAIGRWLDIDNSRSPCFLNLISGLRRLADS